MVKIKLSPIGRKHAISYRLVVVEGKSKITGRAVDILGYWTPQTQKLELDKEKLTTWLAKGVQPTAAVRRLLNL